MGTKIASYATVLGACLIEKHFTLDRMKGGVDSAFSIEPKELETLVKDTKEAHIARGDIAFKPTVSESITLKARRSLYAVKEIKRGEIFDKDNIRSIRPGNGLLPKYFDNILGKRASRDINFGEPLHESMIKGNYKNNFRS